MDIYIKSFNRPYCLDRCLCSLSHLGGQGHRVVILDDGTPLRYLQRIQQVYPAATVIRSEQAEQKELAIQNHLEGKRGFAMTSIPRVLWTSAIREGGDVFLLLEDDMWVTDSLDCAELESAVRMHRFATIKLFWLGNPRVLAGKQDGSDPYVSALRPWYTKNRFRRRGVAMLLENPRFAEFLCRVHVLPNDWTLPAYALYTVAGACFAKEYWLHLWAQASDVVSEAHQLLMALDWQGRHPESRYGVLREEAIATSFLSTASYSAGHPQGFDALVFNHILNEAWYSGGFDSMQGYPGDVPVSAILAVLKAVDHPRCQPDAWFAWSRSFKEYFRALGFGIG